MKLTTNTTSKRIWQTVGQALALKGRRTIMNSEKLFGFRTGSDSASLPLGGATPHHTRRWGVALSAALAVLLVFGWAATAQAQLTPGVKQSTISGTITAITTDAPLSPTDIFAGGTITVGTQQVIIPRNLLLELPANRITLWQFARLSHVSGLAAEGHSSTTIFANRLPDGRVIAGHVLIHKGTAPDPGDTLTGKVTFINNAQGYFRLQGTPNADSGGVIVRLNDPTAVHSIQSGLGCSPLGGPNCSPDDRFILDPKNYTNVFATGFPICIPRSAADAFCPATNRSAASNVVADSTRFAPILVGDHLTVVGNYEVVNGVSFFSAWNTLVSAKLLTQHTPTQPDYVYFSDSKWEVPGYPRDMVRARFFGTGTDPALAFGTAPLFDLFSLHTDQNNISHELPLGSTVNNPDAFLGVPGSQLWRIIYIVNFTTGAVLKKDPCLALTGAGFTVCPGGGTVDELSRILIPSTREVIAHTRHQKELLPGVVALDISGNVAQSGQYLTPVPIDFPAFDEVDLGLMTFPYIFEGVPWTLDRRVGPNGCNGPCEATAQPLCPFPFSGWDPRIVPSPLAGGLPAVPPAARDKIISFFPFGPPNGNGSLGLLQLPPQSGNVPTAPTFPACNEVIIFTPPTVTISSHPPTPTNIKTPTFAFTSNTGTTFQCSLSLTAAPAFSPCTSPFTFPPQLDGTYTFTVVAFDNGLNPSLPATFTFTIDTVPPVVTLTATPPAVTTVNTPSFSFTASKTPVTFQCSLSTGVDAFAPCTSPIAYAAQPDGVYTFKVIATDLAGNVSAPAIFTFTISTRPTVTLQTPTPNSIGIPLNTTVSATFSRALNPATVTTASFSLRAAGAAADVPATVTVNATGTIITLTPTALLAPGTVYTATIAATVADTTGVTVAAPVVWSFTTDTAPTVIAQSPAPGATGVATNATVSATFSKPMNAASITAATFSLRAAGAVVNVPATVALDATGTIATLTPTSPLVAGTVYTATVTATVTDTVGTPLGTASVWSFTTSAAPAVIAQSPTPGAIAVPLTATVTATFSKPMNAASITTATFSLLAVGAAAPVPATVTVNAAGTVATLTPTGPLAQGTVYTATVSATVADTIATPLGANVVWSFTTDVAPTVIAQSPAPGATGVPLNTTVTATFSKPMNAASIVPTTFTLRAAGAAANVPATVTLDATGTIATLTPTGPLALGTVYTATVVGVTDAVGNALGTNIVWSFSTDVAPTVIARSPAPGATGVPLITNVTVTFNKPMNAASITTATFALRAAGAVVNVPAIVTLNAAGTIATLTPSIGVVNGIVIASPLAAGTIYTATVAGIVTDAAGTALGADSVWSFTTDAAATVIAQSPTPNATGVPANTTVTATFSKPMNAASIIPTTFTLRAAGAAANVPATVTLDATGTLATLTPSSPLALGTVYTATVAGSVTDTAGTALGINVAWSFTTAGLTRVQQVSGVTFFDTTMPINLGKTTTGDTLLVGVETNNDVAISSITDTQGNTYVRDAAFAGAPNRLSIWRASNITGGAVPVVTINFVAKETATAVVAEYNGIASVSPFDQTASNNQFGATSYTSGTTPATTQATELVFGVHMNRSTNLGTWTPAGGFTTVLEQDNATSKHQFQVQDQFVTTTGAFASTGTHSTAVTITSLVATYKVGAAAVAPPPPPPPAPVAPTVTAQSPTPNATGVAINTTVTATFSTAMNAATITTASFSLRAAGAAANVPATVTLDATGTIATLTPTTPLAAGTVFTATVAGTVTNAAGTALGANVVWSFTTAPAAPVNAPPTVTAQTPAPNATGVATNTNVTATFSTAMNAATITTATFSLRAAGAAANVPATVTLDATGTIATLTPTTPLAAGTVFTATVAGTVTNAASTALGANVVWSFTTAPAAPVAGAIARVQQVSGETFFNFALPITLGNTTTGHTLLVAIETNNDVAISSITDSQGNTYVRDAAYAPAPNRVSIWRASNITGGTAPVVTISFVAKETATAVVAEYSGLLNLAPFDQTASNNQFGAISYTSGTTPATTQATELVFGVHVNRGGLGTWTPAAGFTTVLERDNATSKHQLQVQASTVTATGGQASTGTHSTAVTITSLVATYK